MNLRKTANPSPSTLRGVEWVHYLFLFPLVLGKKINLVVTCEIGSFLCNLDNLLQKNVIVFYFGNQISKWRSFEKRAIFDLLFTFFSHQGKVIKIPAAHISLTYMYLLTFLPYQFWNKKTNLSGVVSLWYDSWCWFLFAPFWNNQ